MVIQTKYIIKFRISYKILISKPITGEKEKLVHVDRARHLPTANREGFEHTMAEDEELT